jgi:hypothetical protein
VTTTDQALRAAELLDRKKEEAEAVLRRIQEERRSLREEAVGLQSQVKAAQAAADRIAALVGEEVGKLITDATKTEIDKLGKLTEEQMRKSVAKVTSEFDKLRDILLGLERNNDRPSIPEMIDQLSASLDLKWGHFVQAILAAAAAIGGCNDIDCDGPATYAVLYRTPDKQEVHSHLCGRHKEEMKQHGTILKSFHIENAICPYKHVNKQVTTYEEKG